jgi:hypothetical protein
MLRFYARLEIGQALQIAPIQFIGGFSRAMVLFKKVTDPTESISDDLKDRSIYIRRDFLFQVRQTERFCPPYCTGIGDGSAGHDAKKSGFARAVPAHQADPFPDVDLKSHAGEERDIAIC